MLRMFERVVVEVREPAVDRLQPPDAARRHQLPDGDPRRVLAVHERLHQEDARVPAGIDHALGLGGGHRERLLAQDVLAGPRGLDRPARVQVVGQRDVDGVDVGVGEERLVRPVRARDPQPVRDGARPARPRATRCPATSLRGERRRPGITFSAAMFAVDSTPQRTRSPIGRRRPVLHPSHRSTSPRAPMRGADLTRARWCMSLAHVCKKGSQTLRVGRVDVGQRSETVHRANLERHRPRPPRARPPLPLRARRRDRPDPQRDPCPRR